MMKQKTFGLSCSSLSIVVVLFAFAQKHHHSAWAFRCYYLGSRASLDQTLQAYLPALPFPILNPRLARWPPDSTFRSSKFDERTANWIPLTVPGREHTLQCAPNQLPPPSLDDVKSTASRNNPNNIEIINLRQQQMCYAAFGTFEAELAYVGGSSSDAVNGNNTTGARLARFKPGEFFSSFGCVDAKLQSDLVGLFGSADVLNTHAVFTDGCHVLRRAGTQFNGAVSRTTYTFEELRRFNAAAQVPPDLVAPSPTQSGPYRLELGTSAWGEPNTTLARGGVEAVFCFCSTQELCNDAVQLEASVKQNYLDRSADVAIAAAIDRSAATMNDGVNRGRQGRSANTDQAGTLMGGDGSKPPVFVLSENVDTVDSAENDFVSGGRTGRDVGGQQLQQQQTGRYVKCHRQFLRLPANGGYRNNWDLPKLEQSGTIAGLDQITHTRAGDCPLDTEYCFFFDGEQPAYPWLNLAVETARAGQRQPSDYYYNGILVNNFNPNLRYADERETFFWRGCLSPDIRSTLRNHYNFNLDQQNIGNGSDLRYDLPRLMFGYTERCFEFSMSRGQVRGKFCACRAKYCYGRDAQMSYAMPTTITEAANVRAPRAQFDDAQRSVILYPIVSPNYPTSSSTNSPYYYNYPAYYNRPVVPNLIQLSNNAPDAATTISTTTAAPTFPPVIVPVSYTDRPAVRYYSSNNDNYVNDRNSGSSRATVVGVNSDDNNDIRQAAGEEQPFRRRIREDVYYNSNNSNNSGLTGSPQYVVVNGLYYYKTDSVTPSTTALPAANVVVFPDINRQTQQSVPVGSEEARTSTYQNLTLRWEPAPNSSASVRFSCTKQQVTVALIIILTRLLLVFLQ